MAEPTKAEMRQTIAAQRADLAALRQRFDHQTTALARAERGRDDVRSQLASTRDLYDKDRAEWETHQCAHEKQRQLIDDLKESRRDLLARVNGLETELFRAHEMNDKQLRELTEDTRVEHLRSELKLRDEAVSDWREHCDKLNQELDRMRERLADRESRVTYLEEWSPRVVAELNHEKTRAEAWRDISARVAGMVQPSEEVEQLRTQLEESERRRRAVAKIGVALATMMLNDLERRAT